MKVIRSSYLFTNINNFQLHKQPDFNSYKKFEHSPTWAAMKKAELNALSAALNFYHLDPLNNLSLRYLQRPILKTDLLKFLW